MKKKKRYFYLFSIIGISLTFIIGIVVAGGLIMSSTLNANNTFYDKTYINNVDVSGMTVEEASNLIGTEMVASRDEIEISLSYKDKKWKWKGSDFEVNNKIAPLIENVFARGREGDFFERRKNVKEIKQNGLNEQISYKYVLGGLDEKIDSVVSEINLEPQDARVEFNESTNNFEIKEEIIGKKVDREDLLSKVNTSLLSDKKVDIEVDAQDVFPEVTKEDIEKQFALRGKFSTSYKNSVSARKHNIKRALKDFNGMKIDPNQQVSFNFVTGEKTEEKGYKKAKIILNGVFVDGVGGGVCQASTTLYNALLLSDIQIDEVNKHSLPVSYVELAFDAMVSEGYADLSFTNSTNYPIYIKTYGDDEKCYVEVYGEPFEDGVEVKRRAEFVKAIPHSGDTIVQDTNKEYANKITYKGEYLRLKYPQEGYESKAYIDYYKDGKKVDSKLIRHEIYKAQNGVIVEGTEELIEGMTIPENTVEFIPSQVKTTINENNVGKKIAIERPTEYSP